MNKQDLVPAQIKGFKVEHHKTIKEESPVRAGELYQKTIQLLFDINNWNKLSGAVPSYFWLTSKNGETKSGTPLIGDYIRIGIPAPDSIEGEGFDWVRIEELGIEHNTDSEFTYMRVRPSPNPHKHNNRIAHFYSPDSTSTFLIERNNNDVVASYYGRNELPNMRSNRFFDKVRHLLIAAGGLMGFSKLHWNIFIDNILVKDAKS